jgi:hypothetical protein
LSIDENDQSFYNITLKIGNSLTTTAHVATPRVDRGQPVEHGWLSEEAVSFAIVERGEGAAAVPTFEAEVHRGAVEAAGDGNEGNCKLR